MFSKICFAPHRTNICKEEKKERKNKAEEKGATEKDEGEDEGNIDVDIDSVSFSALKTSI